MMKKQPLAQSIKAAFFFVQQVAKAEGDLMIAPEDTFNTTPGTAPD